MRTYRGSGSTYGVSARQAVLRTGGRALPTPENLWETAQYLAHRAEAVRRAVREVRAGGASAARRHHRLTPIEAGRLGKELEPYRPFWLEDATPAENQEDFRLIRQHTTTPLAVGEIFNSMWDCKELIGEQLVDYIRATIVHAGGIRHMRRIADFAAMHQVRTGSTAQPICRRCAWARPCTWPWGAEFRYSGTDAAHGRDR